MPKDEQTKVHWRRTEREIEEDVSIAVRIAGNGKLVRKVPHGHVGRLAEHQPRVLVVAEAAAQPLRDVPPLLVLRAEPDDGSVSDHRVQEHQTLDCPVDCDTPAIPIIRLADGCI